MAVTGFLEPSRAAARQLPMAACGVNQAAQSLFNDGPSGHQLSVWQVAFFAPRPAVGEIWASRSITPTPLPH